MHFVWAGERSLKRIVEFLCSHQHRGSKKSAEHRHRLAKELSDCVVICRSVGFHGFDTSATSNRSGSSSCTQITSFDESKALKLATGEDRVNFVRFNIQQMSRIYPAGLRTNSSNYDPLPMWNVGCQVVMIATSGWNQLYNSGVTIITEVRKLSNNHFLSATFPKVHNAHYIKSKWT
jgi:hypothetical protein